MALGDLSMFSMRNKTTWVERIVGQLTEEVSAEEIISHTQFTVPDRRTTGKSGGRIRRWLKPLRMTSASSGAPLTAVMNVIHDVQVFGTETGIEAIGVPFPHIIFLLGQASAEFRVATEERIAELLRKDWTDLIDPLIELRVRMLVGEDTGQREIVGYFGRGVFAPRHNERPLGHVEISAGDASSADKPTLPGGIPAGIYRGQAALVFSGTEHLAPAISMLLPDNCRFLLRGAGAFDSGSSPVCLECEVAGADPTAFRPLITPIEPPPAGYDAAFTVESSDGTNVQVSVVEDDRPSRLFAAPPEAPFCFAIVGIVEPQDRSDLIVRRWWIDLDRDQNLVASAMRPRCLSVICEGSEIEGYDWNSTGHKTLSRMRLVDVRTSGGTVSVLRNDAGAFGYLLPPPRAMSVGFDESWATSRRSADHVRYDLDWLDFSGAVETSSLYSERLGVHAARHASAAIQVPGLDGRPLPNPGFLARRPREQVFDSSWKGEWEDGTELIVGPFLLRIIDQEQQA